MWRYQGSSWEWKAARNYFTYFLKGLHPRIANTQPRQTTGIEIQCSTLDDSRSWQLFASKVSAECLSFRSCFGPSMLVCGLDRAVHDVDWEAVRRENKNGNLSGLLDQQITGTDRNCVLGFSSTVPHRKRPCILLFSTIERRFHDFPTFMLTSSCRPPSGLIFHSCHIDRLRLLNDPLACDCKTLMLLYTYTWHSGACSSTRLRPCSHTAALRLRDAASQPFLNHNRNRNQASQIKIKISQIRVLNALIRLFDSLCLPPTQSVTLPERRIDPSIADLWK